MQDKIKLLVYLAVWKRPEITELCFMGLNRLRQHPDFDIQVLAVVSEPEMIPLCEKYNVHCVTHENQPLGKKKNFGLKAAKSFEFDYLMEIGSDDLVLNELLDIYRDHILFGKGIQKDFFGIKDVAYIESHSGICRRLQSNTRYGAGRMISRRLLENMDFKLWDDQKVRGLDNNSEWHIMKKGVGYWQLKPGELPMVVDVKSDVNIWGFNHLIGKEYDLNLILDRLSEPEVKTLKSFFECYAEA